MPPKHEVADILGIPVYTLDKVARERGIEPFWTRTSKGKKQKRKQHVIRLIISKEEKMPLNIDQMTCKPVYHHICDIVLKRTWDVS